MCALAAFKDHVAISFFAPSHVFVDLGKQLEGSGKTSRLLKIRYAADIDSASIQRWLNTADAATTRTRRRRVGQRLPIRAMDLDAHRLRWLRDTVKAHPCVLVVEDDASIRDLCAMVLRDDDGYRVETATDGQDGIDHLGCAPDLILLDLGMPYMDGREFVRRLRLLGGHRVTPVLVMTAANDAADVVGTQGMIHKPFEVEALLGRVAELLGSAA